MYAYVNLERRLINNSASTSGQTGQTLASPLISTLPIAMSGIEGQTQWEVKHDGRSNTIGGQTRWVIF